jgi:transposase
MKDTSLLELALGLTAPWQVTGIDFDAEEGRLDLHVDFKRGARFACGACGVADCPVHDAEIRTWRHLNFFQYECYVHARQPRVKCEHCGVKTVSVPWARPHSGFTLFFEALIMFLCQHMPVAAVEQLTGVHDTRLWRIVRHHVDEAVARQDLSEVRQLGVDETSRRRGHNYISVFVDMEADKTVHVCEGKDAATVASFKDALVERGGAPERIEEVCCDMSPAFIAGIEEQFPQAEITFDKYHVIALAQKALDSVRRTEMKQQPELKGTRFAWLKNVINLTPDQKALLDALLLPTMNLKTARAYRLKLALQECYRQPALFAEAYLKKWLRWAFRSQLAPMRKFAHTVKKHWNGILRWFNSQLTNGILEGFNSLIQAAKRKARGYRSSRNLIAMVYLITGDLKFDLPNYPH